MAKHLLGSSKIPPKHIKTENLNLFFVSFSFKYWSNKVFPLFLLLLILPNLIYTKIFFSLKFKNQYTPKGTDCQNWWINNYVTFYILHYILLSNGKRSSQCSFFCIKKDRKSNCQLYTVLIVKDNVSCYCFYFFLV